MIRSHSLQHGFTLMETTATLAIVSIMAVGMVSISNYLLDKSQVEVTMDHLNQLRRAISGTPVIVVNEGRTAFGYVGDMGSLPARLEDLWVKGAQPAFTFDSAKKAGAGWNGPYMDVGAAELVSAHLLDGWGNALVYNRSTFTDPVFGTTALAKLSSLGPDLSPDTSDDVSINFFSAGTQSRVQGYVKDSSDNVVPGVGVTLNYPVNGVLASQAVQTDATGYYFIPDVSFGNRSLTIAPAMVLASDTTITSGVSDSSMRFTLKNFSGNAISITSLTVAYSVAPEAWFGQIKVGNTIVYDLTTPRFGTGDTVSFAAKTVAGTGLASESVAIRVQSPVTDVADLVVGDTGKGGSIAIELNGFTDAETGVGSPVDVVGVSFEITFRNAANQIVGVIVVQP